MGPQLNYGIVGIEVKKAPRMRLCVVTQDDGDNTLASVLVAPEPITQTHWSDLFWEAEKRYEQISETDPDDFNDFDITSDEFIAYAEGLIPLFLFRNPGFTNEEAAEYSY